MTTRDPGDHDAESRPEDAPSGVGPEDNSALSDRDGDGTGSLPHETVELVGRAQQGDEDALNRLLDRYGPRLLRIIRLRLGMGLRRHLESGDIMQETLMAAVRGIGKFQMRNEAALLQWLSQIAENRIRDAADRYHAQRRDNRRDIALHRDDPTSSGDLVVDPEADVTLPPDRAELDEDIQRVENLMATLPDHYREVIVLRDYQGASWGQVAEWISAPSPDAARMLYARAITALSDLMGHGEAQAGGPPPGPAGT